MIRIEDVLKMFWRRFCKTSWRRLENALRMSWQYVLKTSWKRLEDVLKTYNQDEYIGLDQDVLKTSWRRKAKANIFVLIKTSWRRLQEVFWRQRRKTSSRRLQDVFIKTNLCWEDIENNESENNNCWMFWHNCFDILDKWCADWLFRFKRINLHDNIWMLLVMRCFCWQTWFCFQNYTSANS